MAADWQILPMSDLAQVTSVSKELSFCFLSLIYNFISDIVVVYKTTTFTVVNVAVSFPSSQE